MGELEGQARRSDARLAHDGSHLSATVGRMLEGSAEVFDLRIAPHEARETARGGNLQARAPRAGPGELVPLHRLPQPLYVDRTNRLDLDEALGEPERVSR